MVVIRKPHLWIFAILLIGILFLGCVEQKPVCGDGICSVSVMENYTTCPQDCPPPQAVGPGTQPTPTSANWFFELQGLTGPINYYQTLLENKTADYTSVSFLQKRSLTATVNGAPISCNYDDRIRVYETSAQYSESSGPPPSGHGLYLELSALAGPNGERGLAYGAWFACGTTGLPVGAGNVYQQEPSIFLLGKTYKINTTDTANGKLSLLDGTTPIVFTEGSPLTLNGATATTSEWIVDRVAVTDNYLEKVVLRYGNPQNTGMKYDFNGTYLAGLAENAILKGPLNSSSTYLFKFRLNGFGSKTTVVDTTEVSFEGLGQDSSLNSRITTTWTSRDGLSNVWAPLAPNAKIFGTGNPQVGDYITLNLTAITPKRWTIINDKVLYLESVMPSASSPGNYDVTFRIGGVTGVNIVVTHVNSTLPARFTYASVINPIGCDLLASGPDDVKIKVGANDATPTSTTDSATPSCDFYPDVVPFGISTLITTKVPYLDMRYSAGGGTVNTGSASEPWSFVTEYDITPTAIVFDSDDTGGATNPYMGIMAFGNTVPTGGVLDVSTAPVYINQAQASVYDAGAYHITAIGAEMTSTNTGIDMIIPEDLRNVLLEVADEIYVIPKPPGGGIA